MTPVPPGASTSEPTALLRGQSLRVTAPRVAVLRALDGGSHLDADTIARRVRDAIGSVSTQTVYDVLAALTAAGLLRRIEPAGLPALYERRVADNHHHLVCRSCRRIVDIDCHVGSAPCIEPPPPHRPVGEAPDPVGFVVDEAEVIFWGLCPECRGADGAADASPSSLQGAVTVLGVPTIPTSKESLA